MKQLAFICFFFCLAIFSNGQTVSDSTSVIKKEPNADDPSQYFTRLELFNELQDYDNDVYINLTTLRAVVKIAKGFTTRLDVPFVYNTFSSSADYKQTGFGDISFRLLGYNFFERPKSALTVSLEFSLNTAESPLLGTGKNVLIPMASYTTLFPKDKLLVALTFQQANSFSGDDSRKEVSFSKIQTILIRYFSKKMWVVLAPEWYIDYTGRGTVMNLKGRYVFTPIPRTNLWLQIGTKIYGTSDVRYNWSVEVGYRYFLLKTKKQSK